MKLASLVFAAFTALLHIAPGRAADPYLQVSWQGYRDSANTWGASVQAKLLYCQLLQEKPLMSDCVVTKNFGIFDNYKRALSRDASMAERLRLNDNQREALETRLEKLSGKSGREFYLDFVLLDRSKADSEEIVRIRKSPKSIPGYIGGAALGVQDLVGSINESKTLQIDFEIPGSRKRARSLVSFGYLDF